MAFYLSTLWITRHSDDTPELIEAWDNFSIDGNPGGFTAACEQALSNIGNDVRDKAYLTIVVPEEPVFDALYPPDIKTDAVMAGHEDTESA